MSWTENAEVDIEELVHRVAAGEIRGGDPDSWTAVRQRLPLLGEQRSEPAEEVTAASAAG